MHPIYDSFNTNDELLKLAINEKPAIASFHFGIPDSEKIHALKQAGIFLTASATNLDEAKTIEKAGVDAVIAQDYEAGGHRAIFDENSPDSCLSLVPLMMILIKHIKIPVIAAGGIMDGHDIAAMIKLGRVPYKWEQLLSAVMNLRPILAIDKHLPANRLIKR